VKIETIEEAESIGDTSADDGFEAVETIEELEELDEVDEKEERKLDLEKTLAALPEKAPAWNNNDDVELDDDGLSRKLSYSELHDIAKLKEISEKIDELDESLEVLEEVEELEELEETVAHSEQIEETLDEDEPSDEMKLDDKILHLMNQNKADEDDVYRDEILLEKIEFGVPLSEISDEDFDDSVADNFVASAPDYSFLDEEEIVENEDLRSENSDTKLTNKAEKEEELEELEEVEDEENLPFSFTRFATNAKITELEEVK